MTRSEQGQVVRERLQAIGESITRQLPAGCAFALIVAADDRVEGSVGHYVSNAAPADVAGMLETMAARLRGRVETEERN